jgi:aprataxin
MDWAILRKYAKCNPKSFPISVLLTHTKTSLTIFDAYPKSIFHFLIIPRLKASTRLSETDLTSLQTLLRSDKEHAKDVLLSLKKDSEEVTEMIKEEMQKRFGFKWRIWVGFHAVPSLE